MKGNAMKTPYVVLVIIAAVLMLSIGIKEQLCEANMETAASKPANSPEDSIASAVASKPCKTTFSFGKFAESFFK
jgi:hypothetical protein